jgi:putative tricarboxylic transport membrane protein
MVNRDVVVAGVVLAFAAAAVYEAAKLPLGTARNPGPGFFPWWTSVALILLGVVFFAQGLNFSSAAREGSGRIAKVATLMAALAAYALLLELLGYPISTFLLVLFILRATEPQPWAGALGMATITALVSYVLFALWLGVPLPRGPL